MKKKIEINKSSEIKNNPFSGLDFSQVVIKTAEIKTVKEINISPEQLERNSLSADDKKLLNIFEGKAPNGIELKKIEKKKLFMRIEKNRRGGHNVTTLRGWANFDDEFMMDLVAKLRKKLGVGGTFVGEVLEIQGNQMSRLPKIMEDFGYQVKEG